MPGADCIVTSPNNSRHWRKKKKKEKGQWIAVHSWKCLTFLSSNEMCWAEATKGALYGGGMSERGGGGGGLG